MAGESRAKNQKHLHGKARDARALAIADLWYREHLTQEQIAQKFQLSTIQVARDIRRAEKMHALEDHHHRIVTELVKPALDIYQRILTSPDDPDREERIARDMLFGTGLLHKNPIPVGATDEGSEMTLEKWRVSWKKRQDQEPEQAPVIDAQPVLESGD